LDSTFGYETTVCRFRFAKRCAHGIVADAVSAPETGATLIVDRGSERGSIDHGRDRGQVPASRFLGEKAPFQARKQTVEWNAKALPVDVAVA
jgi:hypothetical protein